jgi:L-ascorbate metabolism protein UlaG (beta-lactamase superfamily)
MKITKYYHSCLLAEEGSTKILIDPGSFSFKEGRAKPEDFSGLTAILLTHQHGDHVDANALEKILKKNPVPVYGNAGTREAVAKMGIDVRPFESGTMKLGDIEVEALPAAHEFILSGAPQNSAYLLNGKLLVTGDSLDAALYAHKNIPLLAFPSMAPWMNHKQGAEFLKAMMPKKTFPVHDALAEDGYREGQNKHWENYCKELGVEFVSLTGPGQSLEV